MNSTDKSFESEIRIKIDDFNLFSNQLVELNAKVVKQYTFIDEIFYPITNIDWDIKKNCMRIRTYKDNPNQSSVLFSQVEYKQIGDVQFKKAVYPSGKVNLFTGDSQLAKNLIINLGFQLKFIIEKAEGSLFEIMIDALNETFIIAVEKIKAWASDTPEKQTEIVLAEIEVWADDISDIEKIFGRRLDLLNIKKEAIISDSVPSLIAKMLKIE